jgi:hypothetical protein
MIIFDAVVAADGDHVLTEGEDECHPPHIVHLSEPLDIPITQSWIRREETEILRLWRDPFVEGNEPVRIGRPNRSQMRNAAVSQQHIGFPLSWISGRVRVNISRGLAHGHGQSLRTACCGEVSRAMANRVMFMESAQE